MQLFVEDDFIDLCKQGDLEGAKNYLLDNPESNKLEVIEKALLWAGQYGHLEVCEWLLQINPDIDILEHKEYIKEDIFYWTCFYGHLKVAQWLLQIKPDIYISAEYKHGFYVACRNGHLKVAQWLFQIKPDIDISAKHHFAFIYACEHKYLEVAQWLQSFKPYLYVINYNEDGSYKDYSIRTKEEEQWQKRKYLVWLASNQSPNKESFIYKLPQDVSRYIVEFV